MPTDVQMSEAELWPLLLKCELFQTMQPPEQGDFLKEYRARHGMRIRSFKHGETICTKGTYELDLCVVLDGSVVFRDLLPGSQLKGQVGSRAAGGFYGEAGALGGLPRSTDVVAADNCQIFYLPGPDLKFVAHNNPLARDKLEDLYRDRAVRILAAQLDLFDGVSAEFINQLIPLCKIVRRDTAGVEIIREGNTADSLFIIRDGWIRISVRDERGNQQVVAYRGSNEYIGEMAVFRGGVREATAITAGKCELIEISYDDFRRLIAEFPHAEQVVRATIDRRHEAQRTITDDLKKQLESWGELGVLQNEALLVMDLDLCVKCDECVKACESLHGESRLVRTGIQIDNYLIPSACRHCDDPKCMSACPTGAIKRRPEGEIYFEYDQCTGCANCEIACPYDNIVMIETHKFDRAQERKSRTLHRDFFRPYPITPHSKVDPAILKEAFGDKSVAPAVVAAPTTGTAEGHIPPNYPIKCDLCDGLPMMGCVHNCPTGAAIRVEPRTQFTGTGSVKVLSRVGKAVEVREQRPLPVSNAALIGAVTALIVAVATDAVSKTWSANLTGTVALAVFAMAAIYSARKRSLWMSLRTLVLADRFVKNSAPGSFGKKSLAALIFMDRLETWRTIHVTLGMLAMLPLWWHIRSAHAIPSAMEWLLLVAVGLLVLTGMFGSAVQDFFPHIASKRAEHEVRTKDVDYEIRGLLKQAADDAPGCGIEVDAAYRREIEPILLNRDSSLRLLWTTLRGQDPAVRACAQARKLVGQFGEKNQGYARLLALAERKVRLDQNLINLRFSKNWLPFHIITVLVVGFLLVFHIVSALMFRFQ
jgi:CRP-like cAMP-binding protein/Fe-S-cluster-containing hydrogenase component 2